VGAVVEEAPAVGVQAEVAEADKAAVVAVAAEVVVPAAPVAPVALAVAAEAAAAVEAPAAARLPLPNLLALKQQAMVAHVVVVETVRPLENAVSADSSVLSGSA
jgi:hypothetical protein